MFVKWPNDLKKVNILNKQTNEW